MNKFNTEKQKVKKRFMEDLTALAPELRPAAGSLLEQISASNWTLEWGLPFWLGTTFKISADLIREMLLFNAFGLGFVRLADNIADCESPWSESVVTGFEWKKQQSNFNNTKSQTEVQQQVSENHLTQNEAVLLQVALQHLANKQVTRLAARIQVGSELGNRGREESEFLVRDFLLCFDNYLGQWLRATSARNQQPAVCFQYYAEEDFIRLAERGAPLKVCCAAACALAGRPSDLDTLTLAVDNLLVSCVLLDHIYDWPQDIQADRYNAFVAYCSDLFQCSDNREANREAVLKKLYLKDIWKPYLDITQKFLAKAKNGAKLIGCHGLVEFITILGNETSNYSNWLKDEINNRKRTITKSSMNNHKRT